METRRNFQQQQTGAKGMQTMIFDPKLTLETDELDPDFRQAAQQRSKPAAQGVQDTERSAEDYSLNHDRLDELSLNLGDSKPLK